MSYRTLISACMALLLGATANSAPLSRPNILWLTLEDTSPQFIGCYGNPAAKTPNMDRLAARGIRFTRAFANAPVCSSARSTIITGTLCERLGTGNHRSAFPLPDAIRGFPTFLREAGYHTSNQSKTDYATSSEQRLVRESWNESSPRAGWWNRAAGQPFFSVFNYTDCHQSMTMTFPYETYRKRVFDLLAPTNRVADGAFAMPPFLPDTPAYRKQVARIYNGIAKADQDIGRILDRLEAEKLADDTIIFCYADHGEAIPRGKANPIGLGYRVPFFVVFPEKWRHLNPWGAPGTTTDELICFDDLAPTMLSLIGRQPESWMTGRPFLGTHRRPAPAFIFCGRNRIDESAACTRSVTDGRYVYSRHFLPGPELRYAKYFDVGDIVRLLRADFERGALNEVQASMMRPQPHEVLYDLEADPWETRNLAPDPAHAARVETMRRTLFTHIIEGRDVMLLPEFELARISQTITAYEHGAKMTLAERTALLNVADLASSPGVQPEIVRLAKTGAPAATYWAAMAFRRDFGYDRRALKLDDFTYPPARIEFAAALFGHDWNLAAAEALKGYALSESPQLRLHALQRIQDFGPRAKPFAQVLEQCLKGGTYDTRCSAEVTLHLLDGRELAYANE